AERVSSVTQPVSDPTVQVPLQPWSFQSRGSRFGLSLPEVMLYEVMAYDCVLANVYMRFSGCVACGMKPTHHLLDARLSKAWAVVSEGLQVVLAFEEIVPPNARLRS